MGVILRTLSAARRTKDFFHSAGTAEGLLGAKGSFASLRMTLLASLVSSSAGAQRPDAPAAVKRYFSLVRPVFDGKKAYNQVAFMDQYFRWRGNTGFNASIRRVEETLK